jgi:hypothetical protein
MTAPDVSVTVPDNVEKKLPWAKALGPPNTPSAITPNSATSLNLIPLIPTPLLSIKPTQRRHEM